MKKRSTPTVLRASIATLLGSLALLATSPIAHAAPINFATPVTIAGDTDVFNLGQGLYAYSWATTSQVINGVTLASAQAGLGTNLTVAMASPTINTTAFGTPASAPYSALSVAYRNVLNAGVYSPGAETGTITLNNLLTGHVYATQFWINDSRPISGRNLTITSAGGNSQLLNYSSTNVIGSPGQYTIGTFTANAANQAFTITGGTTNIAASTQITAVQLRDVTGLWSGATNSNWDAGTANFTGGLTYSQVAALTPNIFFADRDGFGNAVTNTSIAIPAGGVTAGTVVIQNSTLPYTFTGADALGIRGTTAVTKTNAGLVTMATTNTYTGVTTLSGGTLSVGAIGDGGVAGGIGQATSAAANLVFDGGTLQYTGATTSTNRNFTILPGKTAGFDVANAGTTLTLNGTTGVSTGGITKAGAGTLLVNGTNLYTGVTAVNAGILRPGSATSLGNGSTFTGNGGTLDLNGLNLTFSNVAGGTATGAITDLSAGAGTSVLNITNLTANLGNLITDGPNRVLAVTIANANAVNTTSNPLNTFSGGLTFLTNAAVGTRMQPLTGAAGAVVGTPGNITSGPYGRGAITLGLVATDRVGIYIPTAGTSIVNALVINTNLGTDRPGIRVDATGAIFSGAILANNADLMLSTNGIGGISLTGPISSGALATGLVTENTFGTSIAVTLNNQTSTLNSYSGNTVFTAKGTLILGAPNQIPDGAGKGNVVVAGKFQMGGFSETINGLSGAGEVDGISGTPTLTVGGNNATGSANSFAGAIKNTAGSLALTKIGTGTMALGGALTYTGATTVQQGTLAINTSLATSLVQVNTGGVLGGTGTVDTATINAGGAVEGGFIGSGTLTVTNLNYTGAGGMNVGALANYASTAAIAVTNPLDLGSNNVSVKVNSLIGVTIGTPYKVLSYVSLVNGSAANFQLAPLPARGVGVLVHSANEVALTVTGTDSIKWTGTGAPGDVWNTSAQNWKLNSNNAATAYIDTSADAVIFGDDAALTETIINLSVANVNPSSVSFANSAKNYTLQGAFGMAGATAVTKDGTGTVTLTNANSYSGTTTVNQGVLKIQNASALGLTTGGTIVNSGAALQIQGGLTLSGETLTLNGSGVGNTGALRSVSGNNTIAAPLVLGAGGATIQTDANTLTIAATASITGTSLPLTVSGAGNTIFNLPLATGAGGSLIKAGAGTLTLTQNSTYTGGTTISGGTLQIGTGGIVGTVGAGAIVNDGSLVFFRSDVGTFNSAGVISGSGSVTYNGPTVPVSLQGQYLVDDVNTYSGGTFINSTRLQVTTSGSALGTGLVTVNSSGQLLVNAAVTVPNDVTIGGNGWLETSGVLGAVRVLGAPTLTGKINMLSNSRLAGFGGSGTFAGVVSGNANLEVFGSGTGDVLTFTAENTYAGTTTITAATMQIGNGGGTGSIGSAAAIINNAALTFNRAGTLNVPNAISGTGVVNKLGTGTTTFAGTNTYAGATNVTNGTLEVAAGGTIASAGALNVSGTVAAPATLTIAGGSVTTSALGDRVLLVADAVGSAGTFNISSGSLSLSGTNSSIMIGNNGAGTYNQTGGTVTYNGSTDAWLGNFATGSAAFNISGGSLTQQNGTFRVGVRAVSTVTISGTAQMNVPSISFGHVSTDGATQTVNLNGGTLTTSGLIFIKGAPTVNFNGTTVGATANNANFLSGAITAVVKTGGAVINTNGFDLTIPQALTHEIGLATPDGGLTKRGAGTLALTLPVGTSMNGPTTVEAGTLALNGSLSASAVTVKGTGTLKVAHNQELGLPLTIESGGTFSPGNDIGTVGAKGGVFFAPGSKTRFDLSGVDLTAGGGVNDLVAVTGNLTLDGALNVSEIGAGSFLSAAELGDSWTLFTYTGTLTNNGLDLGTMPVLGPNLGFAVDFATAGEVHLTVVPEPASALTLLAGLGVLLGVRRSRRDTRA